MGKFIRGAVGVAFLSLAGLASVDGQTKRPDPLKDFDAYVIKSLAQWRVPGVAVAIVRNDSVVLVKGYGLKEQGRTEPVTATTMFEIGSTSKAFSSALVAMLVDDGKLRWDDRVTTHLPWFQLKDPFVTREATLRDLLSHQTGVTGALNGYVTTTREEVIRRNRFVDQTIPFRSRYDYSNMMYATAGEVAQAASGVQWERLFHDRLLKPLGMLATTTDLTKFFDSTRFTHCFYCAFPKDPVSITQAVPGVDVAMPHMLRADRVTVIPWQSYDNAVSAGSIISNATEMAQWLRLLVGKGTYQGQQLIKPETFKEMHRPQSIIRPTGWIAMVDELSPSTHFWNYGLGWRMNDYRGRKIVWHTGGIAGFLAYVGLIPEENIGIVALSNGDLGYELLPQSLAMRVADLHIGAPIRDWSTELSAKMAEDRRRSAEAEAKLVASRVSGTQPPLALDRYAGRYSSDLYGDTDVTVADGKLQFEIVAGAKGELAHWHYGLFRLMLNASNPGGYFTRFDLSSGGQVMSMTVEGLGRFRRLPRS